MEYLTNKLTADNYTELGNAQSTLDCTVNTENKGSVSKLLSVSGEVTITSITSNGANKTTACGQLNVKIICADGEGTLVNYDYVSEYSKNLDIDSSSAQNLYATAMILDIEYSVINGNIKVSANTEFKIFAMNAIECDMLDAQNDTALITRIEECAMTKKVCDIDEKFLIVEEYECGVNVDKVLHFDTNVICTSVKAVDTGINVMGELIACVVYESDGMLTTKQFNVPFSEEFACESEFDKISAHLCVADNRIVLQGNAEDTVMRLEADIKMNAILYKDINVSIMRDACSTKNEIICQYTECDFTNFKHQLCLKDKISGSAELNEESESIRRVLSSTVSRNCLTSLYTQDGMITVEGILSVNVIYEDNNTDVNSVLIELPYSLPFDTDKACANDLLEAVACVEIMSSKVKRDREIDVTAMVCLSIGVHSPKHIKLVADIEIGAEITANMPAFVIYNAHENESLWDIAKNIMAPIEEIVKQNPSLENKQTCECRKIMFYRSMCD